MMGPSLETGAVFDAVLSVNYCKRRAWVSVMAVQEICDGKGRVRGSENPIRETSVESHPFGFAQGRLFSQSARKGWGNPADGNDRGASGVAKNALIGRCSARTMDRRALACRES